MHTRRATYTYTRAHAYTHKHTHSALGVKQESKTSIIFIILIIIFILIIFTLQTGMLKVLRAGGGGVGTLRRRLSVRIRACLRDAHQIIIYTHVQMGIVMDVLFISHVGYMHMGPQF